MTLAAAFVTGLIFALANAAHCAGMCGAFALRAASVAPAIPRFGAYALGKIFTYLFLGSLAGWFGKTVVKAGTEAQSVLGIAVGAMLIFAAVRLFRGRTASGAGGATLARFFAPLLAGLGREDLPGGTFTLGALTGALPCGVVYAAAFQAAATGSVLGALALMAGFGLGTIPALGLVGFVGQAMTRLIPAPRLRFVAGTLVSLMGIVTLTRALLPLFQDGRSCCH